MSEVREDHSALVSRLESFFVEAFKGLEPLPTEEMMEILGFAGLRPEDVDGVTMLNACLNIIDTPRFQSLPKDKQDRAILCAMNAVSSLTQSPSLPN